MANGKTLLDAVLENPDLLKRLRAIGNEGVYRKYFNRPGDNINISPEQWRAFLRAKVVSRKGNRYYVTPEVEEYIRNLPPVGLDENGNVVRYHATNIKGLNGIYNSGAIEPIEHRTTFVRGRNGEPIPDKRGWGFKMKEYTRPVFTSLHSWADEWERPIALKMEIPADEYTRFNRSRYNPDHNPYDIRDYIMSVDRGGTSDFIDNPVSTRYVTEICLDPDRERCYDTSKVPFREIVDIANGVNE